MSKGFFYTYSSTSRKFSKLNLVIKIRLIKCNIQVACCNYWFRFDSKLAATHFSSLQGKTEAPLGSSKFAFRGKMKIFSPGKILVPAYLPESAESATVSVEWSKIGEAEDEAAGQRSLEREYVLGAVEHLCLFAFLSASEYKVVK